MPFLDHLEELRWRILKSLIAIVIGSIGGVAISDFLLTFLLRPISNLENPPEIIALSPLAMIMVRLSAGIVAGLVVALPVLVYQIWSFVSPGLVANERRYVIPMVASSAISFVIGALLAYGIVDMVLAVLIEAGYEGVQHSWNIQEYIGFILRFLVAFGVVFQLPVISFLLSRIGLLTPAFLKHYRRHAVVGGFVLAALLTPPDPFTQVAMALPLLILFQVSIWVSHFATPKDLMDDSAQPPQVDDEASDDAEDG